MRSIPARRNFCMRQFDRIYRLYQTIRARRRAVPMRVLCEKLECSASTVKRAIRDLRTLHAPLEYDAVQRGYFFHERDGGSYELPGLWFNQRELHALLVMHETLRGLRSELLDAQLAPLRARIETLLARGMPGAHALRRVRMPGIGARSVDAEVFRAVSSALFRRRQLRVDYRARGGDANRERAISPQRLVYYRNNWYVDAWCHLRRGLRCFSLDRMRVRETLQRAAREMPARELDAALQGGYGIYSGKAKLRARLRFSAAAAAWVADEKWHPKQRGVWTRRGYELEIPYANAEELVMDILRHSGDVEVLAPAELRAEVLQRLRRGVKQHA